MIVKDREAWNATVHGVAKSRACLRNLTTKPTSSVVIREDTWRDMERRRPVKKQ